MTRVRNLLKTVTKHALWGFGMEIAAPQTRHPLLRLSCAQLPPQFRCLRRSARTVPFLMDLEHVTMGLGFSFASDGYHPYVATLREYQKNSNLEYENSSLSRFFDTFRPLTAQQALLDTAEPPRAVLCSLPPSAALHVWTMGHATLRERADRDAMQSNQHFGPVTSEFGKIEFSRLIKVFESIRKRGYRPSLVQHAVFGHFLFCGNRYRFLLREGQHRAASLRVLGATSLPVVVWHGVASINCANLGRWSTQQGGLFDVGTVNVMFDYLLNESGRAKAARHGLIDAR